jgi:mono/diheme cytochrome c family protein
MSRKSRIAAFSVLAALVAVLLVTALGGCGSSAATSTSSAATTTNSTAAAGGGGGGQALYAQYCAGCHNSLPGQSLAPANLEALIKAGSGRMPGFAGQLTDSQIAAIATYISTGQ